MRPGEGHEVRVKVGCRGQTPSLLPQLHFPVVNNVGLDKAIVRILLWGTLEDIYGVRQLVNNTQLTDLSKPGGS